MSKHFQLARIIFTVVCVVAMGVLPGLIHAQDEEAELRIGSKAPDLDIQFWLSDNNGLFQHTTKLEENNVYVIEFWATWCGPCIGVMPYIVELQEKHIDNRVQFISVSDEDLDTVEDFLERIVPGDKEKRTFSKLTNSYCLTTDPDKSVKKDYFRAANRTGIPCAFVVGKTGLIEWIGHPMELAEPLDRIVDDKWDRDEFIAEENKKREARKKMIAARQRLMKSIRRIQELANGTEPEKAIEMIDELLMDEDLASERKALNAFRLQIMVATSSAEIEALVEAEEPEKAVRRLDELIADKNLAPIKNAFAAMRVQVMINAKIDGADIALGEFADENKNNAQVLNEISWGIYLKHEDSNDVDMKLLKQARKAAEYAVIASNENGHILDTLAHLIYVIDGDLDKAIELQSKAVKNSIPNQRNSLKTFLEQLKEEKRTGKKAKKKKTTTDF